MIRSSQPSCGGTLRFAKARCEQVAGDRANVTGDMKATFVSQPFSGGPDMQSFIVSCTADPAMSHLDIVVAWAKRSGLRLVEPSLAAFKARGGTIRMIVGISEGGATRQGLKITREIATEPYVLHVPGRTFHPKVFVATGTTSARLLVGSQNMTAGGARTNYEAGLDIDLDRVEAEDEALLQAVADWIDDLVADHDVCLPLDDALLAKLIADTRYRVGDEDAPRPGKSKPGDDTDSVVDDDAGSPLFGKSKYTLKSTGGTSKSSGTSGGGSSGSGASGSPSSPPAPTAAAGSPVAPSAASVTRRWFKQLKAADAQQLGGTSNPSGHVTLVNAGHPIDKRVYFRHDFFGSETWKPQGPKNEVCTISAEVVVGGTNLGTRSFTVQHTPAFEAGQGNRSTVLHWDSLSSHMRTTSHVDEYLTIEKISSGGYRITIAPTEAGPFIK